MHLSGTQTVPLISTELLHITLAEAAETVPGIWSGFYVVDVMSEELGAFRVVLSCLTKASWCLSPFSSHPQTSALVSLRRFKQARGCVQEKGLPAERIEDKKKHLWEAGARSTEKGYREEANDATGMHHTDWWARGYAAQETDGILERDWDNVRDSGREETRKSAWRWENHMQNQARNQEWLREVLHGDASSVLQLLPRRPETRGGEDLP